MSAQTLADSARAAQKNKRTNSATNKVYTNDSLGFHAPSDASAKSDADAKKSDKPDAKADAKSDTDADDADPAEAKKKAAEDLKQRYEKQKAELATLQRELDILTRENKLRGATFYADAGNRLRNEQKYAEDDRKYQADVASKKKAIDDATAALDKMKEEGRRTGVPLS
jgi:colicin import membrane protein